MSGQYFGERVNPSNDFERTEPVPYTPVVEADPYTDKKVVETDNLKETAVLDSPSTDNMSVQMAPVSETIPYQVPVSGTVTSEVPAVPIAAAPAPLLSHEESERFRTRWNEIQGKFIDEPRSAVQQADTLVSEVVAQITQMFAKEHTTLDAQWNQGNDVSTEDLRKIIQRYRSFFNRLVL